MLTLASVVLTVRWCLRATAEDAAPCPKPALASERSCGDTSDLRFCRRPVARTWSAPRRVLAAVEPAAVSAAEPRFVVALDSPIGIRPHRGARRDRYGRAPCPARGCTSGIPPARGSVESRRAFVSPLAWASNTGRFGHKDFQPCIRLAGNPSGRIPSPSHLLPSPLHLGRLHPHPSDSPRQRQVASFRPT